MAVQTNDLEKLIEVLKNKLKKERFDKLFEVVSIESRPTPADVTAGELAFYIYLADEGCFIDENACADWQESDVEAHVTSKIVDPVMLQLKCSIEEEVRLSYRRY